MKTDDFDYYLPEELIAQVPLEHREESRLLVLDKNNGNMIDDKFYDIVNYLNKGDVLVLNDTKVMPARLIGEKEETGAVIEVLLLKNINEDNWECLVKPAKRVKEGTIISFGNGKLKAKCTKIGEDGIREFTFIYDGIFYEILDELGTMPLPPYIKVKLDDKDIGLPFLLAPNNTGVSPITTSSAFIMRSFPSVSNPDICGVIIVVLNGFTIVSYLPLPTSAVSQSANFDDSIYSNNAK